VRTRPVALAATGLAVALTLSGCAFITPQQTTVSYQPTAGVNGTVGGVQIRNTLLITTNGTEASLVTVLVNPQAKATTVQVQYDSNGTTASQSVAVPADASVQVTPSATAVTLSAINAPLGSLFDVSFLVGSATTTLGVPVLNTSLPFYASLAPSPSPTPTTSPGATLSPSPDATATPDTLSPSPSPSATQG
jgi:hypothetical protein